jgi:hypothetical protein
MKKLLLLCSLALPLLAAAQTEQYAPAPVVGAEKPQHWCGATEFAGGEADLATWAQQYYSQPTAQQRMVNTKNCAQVSLSVLCVM